MTSVSFRLGLYPVSLERWHLSDWSCSDPHVVSQPFSLANFLYSFYSLSNSSLLSLALSDLTGICQLQFFACHFYMKEILPEECIKRSLFNLFPPLIMPSSCRWFPLLFWNLVLLTPWISTLHLTFTESFWTSSSRSHGSDVFKNAINASTRLPRLWRERKECTEDEFGDFRLFLVLNLQSLLSFGISSRQSRSLRLCTIFFDVCVFTDSLAL